MDIKVVTYLKVHIYIFVIFLFYIFYIFEDSRAYFLFYPIGTLMTINIIFAGLTTYNMYNHNQSAKIAEKKSTKHKRMYVNVNLFSWMLQNLLN